MFKDLNKKIWKGVMKDLEILIPYYELGNRIISLNQDEKLRRYIASKCKPNDIVLEVGSGPGTFIKHLKNVKTVFCIDPSERMIEYSKKRFKKRKIIFKVGHAEKLPFQDNFFDKVFFVFAFRDFYDKTKSIREAYRVLKKDGLMIILDTANIGNIVNKIYYLYLRIITPFISKVVIGVKNNLYDDFIKTIEMMQKPDVYASIAKSIGFSKVWIEYKLIKNVFILYAKK
ncbi:MAG: class I SAM-dependent methyltransferase [Candidatus Asgardarchaeia archaeon]